MSGAGSRVLVTRKLGLLALTKLAMPGRGHIYTDRKSRPKPVAGQLGPPRESISSTEENRDKKRQPSYAPYHNNNVVNHDMQACVYVRVVSPPHEDTGEIWSGYEWEELTVCSSFSVVTSMV
ncbi:hypothetical protein EYF80_023756 [Liparis tanakae]|uniref:Uncharacterized protein n=1 Tax=Liparis tanakae TaxID=230148 RepID=A0A4Z2HK73_9TELE|nr:hypothetical protein EYF80_023756 [Liparis tanakae]